MLAPGGGTVKEAGEVRHEIGEHPVALGRWPGTSVVHY